MGKKQKMITTLVTYILLTCVAMIFLLPLVWLVSTSLKSPAEIFQIPPKIFPSQLYWENYRRALTQIPYLRYLRNTLFITVFSIIGQVFAAPLVAYSVCRIRWFGRRIVFFLVISTLFLPYQVTMIPEYIIYYKLGLIGTYIPLILPNFFGGAFYIFLLRQFMLTLPESLIEAAKIDGASHFKIYWQIILPLIRPAIATVVIFTFLGTWSDFLRPFIYLNKENMYTLSVGLRGFLTQYTVDWGPLMAAAAIFVIPIITIFFLAQRYFTEGISLTGGK